MIGFVIVYFYKLITTATEERRDAVGGRGTWWDGNMEQE